MKRDSVDEIRTKRLVIEDANGNPRIVGEVVNGVAELRVQLKTPNNYVLIYAGSLDSESTDGLGVELFTQGGSIARMVAWQETEEWRTSITTDN